MPVKTSKIMLRLRELPQLFNSMDPSPFIERDLDADAEEFIMTWARELPLDEELELVIQVATEPPPDKAQGVQGAVRQYFQSRMEIKQREFTQLMRRGRLSLMVGLVFLAVCLFLETLLARVWAGTGADIAREGLTICGWVAMWRPLEIYLYDWWPLRDERRILQKLARMHVRLVMPNAQGQPSPRFTDVRSSARPQERALRRPGAVPL